MIVRTKVEVSLKPEQPSQKLPNYSFFQRFLQLFRSHFSLSQNSAIKQKAATSLLQDSDIARNAPAYVENMISSKS